VQIDVDHLSELVRRLSRGRDGRPEAGVVDQNIDSSELLHGARNEPLTLSRVSDIGDYGQCLAPGFLDQALGLLEAGLTPRPEDEIGAGLGKRKSERNPESGRCPGDHRHLVAETKPANN
jgi:hypothetical protein